MANCLIAGCGQLGQAIAERLIAQGHDVWALRRSDKNSAAAWQTIVADLADAKTLTNLPANLDFVFFTAAADQFSEQAYQQTYVDGVQNLLTALEQQQQTLTRFFFTSSTAVYAQTNGEWVDEDSVTEPTSFSGKAMLAAENLVKQSHYPETIVRLSGIYGPGRVRLINSVREGTATLTTQDVYTNRIHIDDAASVFVHLMDESFANQIFIGTDCMPVLKNDVLRYLAKLLNINTEQLASDDGRHPQRGNKRCSNKKLLASGFEFTFADFQQGYESIIASCDRVK